MSKPNNPNDKNESLEDKIDQLRKDLKKTKRLLDKNSKEDEERDKRHNEELQNIKREMNQKQDSNFHKQTLLNIGGFFGAFFSVWWFVQSNLEKVKKLFDKNNKEKQEKANCKCKM